MRYFFYLVPMRKHNGMRPQDIVILLKITTFPAGTATLAQLQQEKRIELCFEAHRWFDIIRWNLGPTIFGAKWNNKYSVFPYPQTEIDRTKGTTGEIKQNTGY